MTGMGGGYQEPSGIYYSEMEPMRFLRLINFANSQNQSTDKLLSNATGLIDSQLSNSAYRFKYYHYDEWKDKEITLGGNVTSGLLDWMRSNEPVYWYYYDLGPSGNFTRRIIKCAGFPYDDISTIPIGDIPLNYSFPLINSSGNRIKDDTALLLPFYQSVGLIEQIQSHFETMFDNPITNSVHPIDTDLTGIPIPQIPKETALQLNNLSLKPSGFISEYGAPRSNISGIIFPLNIVPGSGFQPILDMAQQINYPREYISNLSAIIPSYFSPASVVTDCNNFGTSQVQFGEVDIWKSSIYFGFMQPSSISIQFSGVFPTYNAIGTEIDRFGNTRQTVNIKIFPTLTYGLKGYGATDTSTISLLDYSFSPSNVLINTSGIYSYTIINNSSGNNPFNRYYDPLGDGNSNNVEFKNSSFTTNYSLQNITGWSYAYSGGNACLSTSNLIISNIPDLRLDTSNISLKINGVEIPTTRYPDARKTPPIIGATNSIDQKCFNILTGSTITVNYTMPAINCRGYNYSIGQAVSNPGASNTSQNCTQWNGTTFVNICQFENFYRASKWGFCCPTGPFPNPGVCTNVNDYISAFFGNCNASVNYSDCFVGFVPGLATLEIKNSCGDRVAIMAFGGSLPPSGVYNTWTNVQNSATFGVAGLLNSWQNLTGYLTLRTERECVTLSLSQTAGAFINGCFKDPPIGQPIDTHAANTIPCNGMPYDSNDLAITNMITSNDDCYSTGAINSLGDEVRYSDCNNNTSASCVKVSNSVVCNGGMTVTIDSIDCHFIVACPDGTTSTVDFSLPGFSLNYAEMNSFTCSDTPPQVIGSASLGSAPSICGSWW